LKSVLWAYSNPKWPVGWVANWSIIPPLESTRGQNRPPTPPPPLGGGGPHSIYFRATGRLYTTIHCKSELPCHERWLSIKNPNPKWPLVRVVIIVGQKCPNRHELKGKTGPQYPLWGPKHSQYSIFRPIGATNSCCHSGCCLTVPGYC
jgi:hypothetical protein